LVSDNSAITLGQRTCRLISYAGGEEKRTNFWGGDIRARLIGGGGGRGRVSGSIFYFWGEKKRGERC